MQPDLVVSERKYIEIFHLGDLWPKSLYAVELLNSKGMKLTAFRYHRAQLQQKMHIFSFSHSST